MANEIEVIPVVAQEVTDRPKPRGFYPGHPRWGGRKKGSPTKRTAEAREIAERMGFHPVEWFAGIALTGQMPNPDGSFTTCDAAMRLDAGKHITKFLIPALANMQVTGKDGGPVQTATLDVTKMLANPAAARLALELAMAMAEDEQARQIEPAEPLQIEQGDQAENQDD